MLGQLSEATLGQRECHYEAMLDVPREQGENLRAAVRVELYRLTKEGPSTALKLVTENIDLTAAQRMVVNQCVTCIFNEECTEGYVFDRPAPKFPTGRLHKLELEAQTSPPSGA